MTAAPQITNKVHTGSKRPRPPRGRPKLRTSYAQDMALLNTPAKRWSTLLLVVIGFCAPLLFTDDLLQVLTLGLFAAIGAIGLNLVSGYAGQVSLGHAFFMGLGAYTAAVLGGDSEGRLVGFGLPIYIWLPAAGLVAAAAGLLIGPLAVRLRGLYLAIVTLGVVFLGLHLFREANHLTGGPGVGRRAPDLEIFGINFSASGGIPGLDWTRDQQLLVVAIVFLIIFGVAARNIARSGVGRAFSSIRDRDVAAAVIGVDLTGHKVLAFGLSSFYAGAGGALYYTVVRIIEPTGFDLLLSVQFLAMVLIGGVATISGAIMGAIFITALGRIAIEIAHVVPFVSTSVAGGGLLNIFQLEGILYGLLIIGFLIAEPRGLYGIWIRIRNYWKGWPFSY
ncbi:branched-chain amino acid ABC transporter permease [Nesterenkonia alkaliphila]|uniref:Branched-chain amino acid ABC transporter permease n=1 Tax=Nesterenkonia alkaliphila TaxID=1463631 RepID=A0A7K1UIH8_9MICC|nr:branched-chain amino acid ABC transporter permease [Nesterenkonia alkaliphila]MVT26283.1 branched-chain amino acid ABC transporter permease [Nesterenkonia alkaliphila]GFZ97263.1 branched-chain amino acid ABC transporter permease [Nesterenkonia alkaliphila]